MSAILTIAIPTYNRADKLDGLLQHLVSDDDYDPQRIEIIVSDNASTDNTALVVAKYPSVRYSCNEKNIGFGNFTVVMELATGRYARLMNDTARFSKGMLGLMLKYIEEVDCKAENLIFANELIHCKQGVFLVGDKDAFMDKMSYFVTWIGNFGMWIDDFHAIKDKDRFISTLMQHVDWVLCMVGNGKPTRIVVERFVNIENTKKKGSYDIYDTFITKYFSILKFYKIDRLVFAKEKYRLFRYFLLNWYFLLKKDKEYTFDTSGSGVMFRRYWYELYFLPLLIIMYIKHIT